jgi:redox-sensitive bicupin YhaK (pirin superfamily)
VHLLQIWIQPEKAALPPSYEQKAFPASEKSGKLRLIASRDTSDGSVKINQDAKLYVSLLKPAEEVTHEFAAGRHGWLQVARGTVEVNGKKLGQGDGAAISDEKSVSIKGVADAEVLLFDLA